MKVYSITIILGLIVVKYIYIYIMNEDDPLFYDIKNVLFLKH